MSWSAKRKLLHAEMLGAYHEARNEDVDDDAAGGWDDPAEYTDYETSAEMQRAARQAGVDPSDVGMGAGAGATPNSPDTVPSSPRQGRGGDPTQRHEQSWDFSDDDTDWQFCPQCQGLFEPDGEFEAHFDNPEFPCQRDGAGA